MKSRAVSNHARLPDGFTGLPHLSMMPKQTGSANECHALDSWFLLINLIRLLDAGTESLGRKGLQWVAVAIWYTPKIWEITSVSQRRFAEEKERLAELDSFSFWRGDGFIYSPVVSSPQLTWGNCSHKHILLRVEIISSLWFVWELTGIVHLRGGCARWFHHLG